MIQNSLQYYQVAKISIRGISPLPAARALNLYCSYRWRSFPPVARSHSLPALPYLRRRLSNPVIADSACISFNVVVGLGSCSCRVSERIWSISFCSVWCCTVWGSLPLARYHGDIDPHPTRTSCRHIPLPHQPQWQPPGLHNSRYGELHPPSGAWPECSRPWSWNGVSDFLKNLTWKQKSCSWREIRYITTRYETAQAVSNMTSQCKINN